MTFLFIYVAFILPALAVLIGYGAVKLAESDGRRARRMIDAERARQEAGAQPS